MSETLTISQEEVKTHGLEKNEDGYYCINIQAPIGNTGDGVLVALLNLNEIPEGLDVSNPESIGLQLDPVKENKIGYPNCGTVAKYTVVSVSTNDEFMFISLVVDNIETLHTLHLDHIPYVQMQIRKDKDTFLTSRPGEQFYLMFDMKSTREQTTSVENDEVIPNSSDTGLDVSTVTELTEESVSDKDIVE